ncbi:MAG: PEP/pyruvate-binding domain-containing protein [Desulfitobacteriaceae bacterium]
MTVKVFGQLDKKVLELAGGKGANLNDMVSAGFPVPEGYVICSDVFSEFIRQEGLFAEISTLIEQTNKDDGKALELTSTQIQEKILKASAAPGTKEQIIQAYRQLCQGNEELPVAVRSSSTAEDLEDASFAGQQETFLYVIGEEELLQKVKECWASLYNSRAIFYRSQKGFSEQQISIAVVVQRMINSEKAGVMFTVNPINKKSNSVVIEAVWGQGEAAVSGVVTPDSYIVSKDSFTIENEFIPIKESIIVQSESKRGVQEKQLPPEKAAQRVLEEGEIHTLVDYGKKLEQYFEKPQDVEWAIEGDEVYILQSRPVTTLNLFN